MIAILINNENHLSIFLPVIEKIPLNKLNELAILFLPKKINLPGKLSNIKTYYLYDQDVYVSGLSFKKYYALYKLRNEYRKILKSCSKVLIASDFHPVARIIVSLAKELGFEIYLLQDGNIETKFPAFDKDYEKNLLHFLKVSLRTIVLKNLKFLGLDQFFIGRYGSSNLNGIFVWGKHYKNVLTETSIPCKNIIITGSPKHDEYKVIPSNRITNPILLKRILIANACPIKVSIDYKSRIKQEILDILRISGKVQNNISVTLKLHPRMDNQDEYKSFLSSAGYNKVEIVKSENVYELLPLHDLVLTTFSTVGFEAFLFGVPSVFTFINFDKHRYNSFIKEHVSVKNIVNTEKELEKFLFTFYTSDSFREKLYDETAMLNDLYFNTGSKELASDLIEKIVIN